MSSVYKNKTRVLAQPSYERERERVGEREREKEGEEKRKKEKKRENERGRELQRKGTGDSGQNRVSRVIVLLTFTDATLEARDQ